MKRAIITGSSRGIGRATAIRLAADGYHIILHGRDKEALAQSKHMVEESGGSAEIVTADLSRIEDVQALSAELKNEEIHLLINNAGWACVKPVEEITPEDWQRSFAVNVTAPFLLTQKYLPMMTAGASIVNILSIAARTGFPGWSAYCMSKFALNGWAASVREELRNRGIRMINLYPGATNTDIWNPVPGNWPREKMLSPSEIAEAIHYAVTRPSEVLLEDITLTGLAGTL